jgi:hypothetical protein
VVIRGRKVGRIEKRSHVIENKLEPGSVFQWGQQYADEGAEAFERRYQELRIATLKAKAAQLGYELLQKA